MNAKTLKFLALLFLSTLARAQKTTEALILENPVKFYKEYRLRLKKFGPNASFPEFKPVVEELQQELESERIQRTIAQHPALGLELTEVRTLLAHVNLKFKIEEPEHYPYDRPFESPFPYRPTIDAIEDALRLIDKVERLTNPKVKPLYHFDRYAYHRHSLLADEDVIVFPTLRNLTFQDLIRVRGVPIGFVGVTTKTIRVDRHYQSPLDFWYHDLNHVRRMVAYIAQRAKKRGASSYNDKIKFYREMDEFIVQKIIPNIKALPKGSAPEDVAVRRIVRVVLFEIVHETALTAERETILHDLLRGPQESQPFEHMIPRGSEFDATQTEALRTATGNLQSGATAIREKGETDNGTITIRYFFDRALGLLANVYNKLNYGFFDDPADPNKFVAPPDARKAEYIVRAAQKILVDVLGVTELISNEHLTQLVLSKEGSPEKFVYPG